MAEIDEMELYFHDLIRGVIKAKNENTESTPPTAEQYSKAIIEKLRKARAIAVAEFSQSVQMQTMGKIDQDIRNFSFTAGTKKIKSKIFWQFVNSSWIRGLGYDFDKKILYVAFLKPSKVSKICDLFAYYNIEQEKYLQVLNSTKSMRKIRQSNNMEGVSFDRIGMLSGNSSLINYSKPRTIKEEEQKASKFAFNNRIKEIDQFFSTNTNKIDYRAKIKNAYANSYEKAINHLTLDELFVDDTEKIENRLNRLKDELTKKLGAYYLNEVSKIITDPNIIKKGSLAVTYGALDALLDYFKNQKDYNIWKE